MQNKIELMRERQALLARLREIDSVMSSRDKRPVFGSFCRKIFDAMPPYQSISTDEISRLTGLSKPRVSKLICMMVERFPGIRRVGRGIYIRT